MRRMLLALSLFAPAFAFPSSAAAKQAVTRTVGHFQHRLTMRPDGKVLYVSLWHSDAVAAIDMASRKVIRNVQFARATGPKRILIAKKP